MPKHLVMIAGEESGDQHAAKLLKQLLIKEPDLIASGMGGKHLEALGFDNIFDLTKFAITGLSGVFTHIKLIKQAFKIIKKHLRQTKPDIVVLVDYPGFNLRMAKWIKKNLSCPILYYISPQLWAWKPKRIEIIKQYVDHMAVILPFELDLYQKHQIPASYVGHPLSESLSKVPSQELCRQYFRWKTEDRLLAVCPGSRPMEISRHLPVIIEALKLLDIKDLKIVVPVAKSLNRADVEKYFENCPYPYHLIDGQAQMVMKASNAVVVSSGTASLESAILKKPTCIIYKSSWINHYLALKLIQVKYFGLSNLLQNQMVVPELLQTDCNAQELAKMIHLLLEDETFKNTMLERLEQLEQLLTPQSSTVLPDIVHNMLTGHTNDCQFQ